MRAVNLMPRELASDRSQAGRAPIVLAAGGIAAMTVIAVVLFMSAAGSIGDQRSQLESVEAAIGRVPVERDPVVAPGIILQERSDRVAALSAALATRAPLDRLLREIALVLPEDAWLTSLIAAAPAAAPTSGATAPAGAPGVTIQGATYSHQSVARVLARFAALPTLTNVRLTASARVEPTVDATSKKSKKKQKSVVTFTITANVRNGATT